jgi:hypothetical protein
LDWSTGRELNLSGLEEGPVDEVDGVVVSVEVVGADQTKSPKLKLERAFLEESLPNPPGARWARSPCRKFSKQWRAMNLHMPLGYAARGEVLNPPSALRPIVAFLCTCPQLRGRGPV